MNKKYISLGGILLMAFILNITPARAEYGFSGNVSAQVGADGTTTINVDGMANPATGGVMPVKGQFKVNAEQNAKLRAEIKEGRNNVKENREGIRDDRENFRDEKGEIRDDIKDDREKMKGASESEKGLLKQDIEDKRGEIKDKKEEMRKEVREKIAMNLMQRIENLTKISERVKIRIAKVKAKGIDMTVATDLQIKADASIAQAKDLAIKAKASIDAGATKEEIKANIQAVKDTLKQAHTYLEQAVKEIKSKVEVKNPKAEDSSKN